MKNCGKKSWVCFSALVFAILLQTVTAETIYVDGNLHVVPGGLGSELGAGLFTKKKEKPD